MEPLFTVGHSTHPLDEFVRMLEPNGVKRIVDVRAFPRSRTNPQYNIDALSGALAPHGIAYEHLSVLGGKRGRSKEIPEDVNAFWDNESFHNYADYAMGAQFQAGLARLLAIGEGERVAIMCAESVWWRCHRRIIADYLLMRGRPVLHLMGKDRVEPAGMTPAAEERDGRLVYPAPDEG